MVAAVRNRSSADERTRSLGGAVAVGAGDRQRSRARRDPAGLALDQVGGGGHLVGHRDLGDLERPAVAVGPAPPVVEGAHAGQADGHVGLAEPPGPAEGVGDHHGHVVAVQLLDRGPQPGRRGVRVGGQQHQPVARRRWTRRPGRWPRPGRCAGLGDDQPAAPGHHPDGLGRDRWRPGPARGPAGSLGQGDRPALGLGHHLGGDGQHVAVGQLQPGPPDRRQQQPSQVVALAAPPGIPASGTTNRAAPLTGAPLRGPPGPPWPRAAASSTVRIRVGTTTGSRPRAATSAAWPASTASSTKASASPAYRPATPRADTSAPQAGSSLSAMPRTGAPADDRGDGDDPGRPPPPTAARIPGTARMGAIDTTGLDGGRAGPRRPSASASSDPGRRPGLLRRRPGSGPPRTGSRACAAAPSTPGSRGRAGAVRAVDLDPGARPAGRSWAPAAPARPGGRHSSAVAADSGHALGQHAASAAGGWRCRGRRGRTTPGSPRRTERLARRSRSRRPGPSRAPRRCQPGQGVGDRVQVGRHRQPVHVSDRRRCCRPPPGRRGRARAAAHEGTWRRRHRRQARPAWPSLGRGRERPSG